MKLHLCSVHCSLLRRVFTSSLLILATRGLAQEKAAPKPASAEAAAPADEKNVKPDDPGVALKVTTTHGPVRDEVVQLNALVVTGSSIPMAADATDAPVVVLGRHDIEDTGLNSNLLEILRKSVPAFAGRSNTGNSNATNTNQNTAGGSQIALRNLDTLILIDGRRVATSGANGLGGGKNFVDINQIPVAAIDHIEVLTDGASAIYGSDAIGGVINIILKSNYNGSQIGGRYAVSTNSGHYAERSAYVTAGAARDGASLTASVSWSKTDPLWQYQRPFIANNLKGGTAYPGFAGGNFLVPTLATPSSANPTGLGATAPNYAALAANGSYLGAGSSSIPLFNASPYISMLLRSEQSVAMVNGTFDIVPKKLVAFGNALLSRTKSFNQTSSFFGNLQANVTVPAGAPFNPLTVAATGVSVGYLDHPLQTFNKGTGDRFAGGLRGEINENWNWEIGGTYSSEKVVQRLVNNVYVPNVNLAIAGGYNATGVATPGGTFSRVLDIATYPASLSYIIQPALDPFARIGENAASLANLYGTQQVIGQSKLTAFDGKIVGTPILLPAGKAAIAVGAATRTETMSGTPDKDSYTKANFPNKKNWAAGLSFDPFSKRRTIDSLFTEVRIPVIGGKFVLPGVHALDLSFAERYEKYSDVGNSTVPKFGVRWQPVDDQFTLHFTYSKAFAAPDLSHEYAPPNATLSSSATFFAANLPPDPRLNTTFLYYSGNGNNPNLKPSQAWTRNLGFVLSPQVLKGFSLSVDYSNLFYKGLPAGIGGNNILNSVNTLGAASPYFSAIAVGGLAGQPGSSQALLTAPGGLAAYLVGGSYANNLYITDHFVNSGGIHVQSVDIRPEYQFHTAQAGTWTIGSTGTYLKTYQYQTLPNAPFYEFAGYSTNGQTIAGSMPKYSFYTTLDWKMHAWETTVGNTYSTSMTDIGSTPPAVYLATRTPTKIDAYCSWDFQESYTFDRAAAGNLWSYLQGLRVTVGANNVFNRMPPYAGLSQNAANNNNNADTAQFSPIGRLLFISASIKF
jgi:iron complex outermembrane receptor protein